jgi:hypothetical protein
MPEAIAGGDGLAGVTGPVDWAAFRRLAAICFFAGFTCCLY